MNLENSIRHGAFREDLYHRLSVFVIWLPPLREREGDIEVLSKYFLDRFNRELGRSVQEISSEAMVLMHRYGWPGNVRELENAIKSAVILAEDEVLPRHLTSQLRNGLGEPQAPLETSSPPKPDGKFLPGQLASRTEALKTISKQAAQAVERQLIVKTLLSCHWNKAKAARQLGIDYKTLHNKIKAYGIT
jgi:transcriptional regulator with GAF, ATPase, and Fis domain